MTWIICPSLAFIDINPVSVGHTQVIPKCMSLFIMLYITDGPIGKDHARTIADLPDEYLSDIGPLLKKVSSATGAEHYNVVQARTRDTA